MLIVLTDILSCPRCGPEFGLLILADRMEERRVLEGSLGCANCRELFPVRDGLADLRFPLDPTAASTEPPAAEEEAPPEEEEAALRLAALMGVAEGPGVLLVAGDRARLAGRIAGIVPHVGVVAAGAETAAVADVAGTSRLRCADRLPLRTRSVRGVALTGEAADLLLEEGMRVLAPGGRIVLEPAPEGAAGRLEGGGYRVILAQADVMVASVPARR